MCRKPHRHPWTLIILARSLRGRWLHPLCLRAASIAFGAIKTSQSITPRPASYPTCLTPAVTHFVFTVENFNGCRSVAGVMVL